MFLARPGYNGNRHMEAVVVDSTANSIVVEDLTGDLETVRWTGERAELCGAAGAAAPTNGAPLIITGTTATTLTVAGDARGVASGGTVSYPG